VAGCSTAVVLYCSSAAVQLGCAAALQ